MERIVNFLDVDFETVFYVMQIFGWIFAFIVALVSLIKTVIKSKKKKKELKDTVEKMEENKNNQMEEEKKMAKFYFLCDKCGKQVNAENGKKLTIYNKAFDLCEECNKTVREKINNVANAKREFENAQLVYNTKKAKFEELQKSLEDDVKTQTSESVVEEKKFETIDIKNALGI